MNLPDVADQSNTEGDAVNLQIGETDWASGTAMSSGSGSGYNPWSASGLPGGLGISSTGLISGTIQPGDAADGPYFVTVSYTDAFGNTASQSFLWNLADPVTIQDPGEQSAAEGTAVSLPMQAGDSILGAAPLTFSASGLPAGLSISGTGLISGTMAAGDAAVGLYDVTVTATDGTYTNTLNVSWDVCPSPGASQTGGLSPPFGPATAANPLANFFPASGTLPAAAFGYAGFGLLPATVMLANKKPGAVADIPWYLNPPINWQALSLEPGEFSLPIDLGALPDLGYGLLQGAAEEKAEAALTHQIGIVKAIHDDWTNFLDKTPTVTPSQTGGWFGLGNTLVQQLGLDSKLDVAELKIKKQLEGQNYSSIQFATQSKLIYRIVSRNRMGQPVTPYVLWYANLVLGVTAKNQSGKTGSFVVPIARTPVGRYEDERYADYDYLP